ncbi:sensor histidine kinase [Gabonibacter chumensis]|uniref:sensor histidine kinase n=1 Tax=Gabonibacter chumensis TaxID=2972474 RepID=UPI002574497B|nr:HAMP domain-containing sensor histidine kinase [Gabonibacter chumensis]MCR9012192.1 HAMP domain-containing histidine kinase [Gabonibacter chumensis]
MVIKKLFGTIGGIVLVMLFLLMVNQAIICHRLYRAERLHWGREVTDILTENMDSLVCVINKQVPTEACRYSEQTEATFFFSSLDRLVREELPEDLKGVEFYYVAKKLAGGLISFFPDVKKDTANKIATPAFLSKEGEIFRIYFDLPLALFGERFWQQLGSIFISFLLLLFLLAGIVYLNRRQRKLVSLQEGMMQQIVHDFNTPLNSVSTLLELLRENTKGIVSEGERKKYDLMESEMNNMRRASTSLLSSLSQICDADIEKKMFDLREGIFLLIKEQQWANRNKKEVRMELDYRIPVPMIYASPVHLFCVIRNLLDNAVKYSDEIVDVTIQCYVKGNGIVIAVSDKGKGIPKKWQKKVFMKYYRGEDRKRRVKGFGLGLAYVKRIVKAHGGKIGLESTPGEGSVFSIYLNEW